MSLLFSIVSFAAQLIAIASIISIITSCVSSSSTDFVFVSEDHPSGAVVFVNSNDSDATLFCVSSCAKSMMPSVITTTISDNVITDDYSALTIRQLKALCRERHIKGYSSLRKHELVVLLQH